VRARFLVMVLAAVALAGCGAEPEQERVAAGPAAPDAAQAPLPQMRPRVVQPEAGVAAATPQPRRRRAAVAPVEDAGDLPVPTGPASAGLRRPARAPHATGGVDRAFALPNGVALPPLEAPDRVLDIIRAGNSIARTPYKWGGGHGKWLDDGYDCSGSVSYALNAGGLIPGPATSGQLMHWGKPGRGRWVTIYANDGHVFMEVAGIRFDTSGAARTGSRWQNDRRATGGYVARHPPGL
jgi:cell wall-associated NlpC family hydrolase